MFACTTSLSKEAGTATFIWTYNIEVGLGLALYHPPTIPKVLTIMNGNIGEGPFVVMLACKFKEKNIEKHAYIFQRSAMRQYHKQSYELFLTKFFLIYITA